jgi:thiol:disulfide interchange protein DsbA
MKKIISLFIALVVLPLGLQAATYKEGVNYTIVKQTATDQPEVLEFFSYYCPHCKQFEPLIEALIQELDKNVVIKTSHVNFMGGESGKLLTRALAAAQLLDVEKKFTSVAFDAVQVQRQAINNEGDIIALFKKAGVSEKEAKSAMDNFVVAGNAAKMDQDFKKFQIRGVPALIVNGKYQVKTSSVKNIDEFVDLVTYLTQKKD